MLECQTEKEMPKCTDERTLWKEILAPSLLHNLRRMWEPVVTKAMSKDGSILPEEQQDQKEVPKSVRSLLNHNMITDE